MKRRRFVVAAGAAALVAAASVRSARARAHGPDERYSVGAFILERSGNVLRVRHQRSPGRVLWETPGDGNFIAAQIGQAEIAAFGTPEGSYSIHDSVSAQYDRPEIESIHIEPGRAIVLGQLRARRERVAFSLAFTALSARHLRFRIACEGQNAAPIDRICLRIVTAPGEGFFGFGEQLTYFNQRGALLPILVQEHGVGRGQPIVTQLVDRYANRGGGTPYVTEAPAPHFLSSALRSLFLENTEYSTFDLRRRGRMEIKVHSGGMSGRILYGESPLELIEAYSDYAGRMRALPDWIHNGAIVSVQGGTDVVRAKLERLEAAGVPLAGLWIQDWTGVRETSAGKQLWWNWRLDESFYPHWQEIVDRLKRRDARMLVYINPFLTGAPGHDALYTEAQQRGFLVRKADGTPYAITNTDFSAALLDLSNADARTWIKDVIKNELIGKAAASGWMADFGEALPFDGTIAAPAGPAAWHNRYPVEWARVNREAIEEAGRGDDIVFFNRSGFTQSPSYATLFWLGDQLQDWDEFDGIKTAVVGLLSGGISGFSLLHSDTGGYVALSKTFAGKKFPLIARSRELLMRWVELNAFTSVLRTHEGLDPAISAQVDGDDELLAHFKRFATVYRGLAPYRKRLVEEAARHGHPVVRHPFLHFPNDPETYGLRYQFLLGPDLLVAPVLDRGAATVSVYFPQESEWVDLWTGKDAGREGAWQRMPAPLSAPAVFVRKGASSAAEIQAGLKAAGIL